MLDIVIKVLKIIVIAATVYTMGYSLYQLYVSLPLFMKYRSKKGSSEPYNKFAIVISAHDEEMVIENLIRSLKFQKYPDEHYDIFVIADNCSDKTAELARKEGAIVYERFDPSKKSKGYALNWFFQRFLVDYKDKYKVCTIFDADNVINENFLLEMNKRFNAGERVIVGYRMGKNPVDSITAGCNSLFWIMQTRASNHPRYMTGRSLLSVSGTGFSFALDIIEETGWKTESLTEDLEFSMDMNLRGERITYCREARFYDEQPITMRSTMKQRWRWSYGSKELMQLKAWKLLKSVFSGRFDNIDSFLFSISYAFLLFSPILWILSLALETMITKDFFWLLKTLFISILSGQISVSLFIFTLTKLEKQHWKGQWKAILAYPAYLLVIGLTIYMALVHRPGWKKIAHTDKQSIEDLESTLG